MENLLFIDDFYSIELYGLTSDKTVLKVKDNEYKMIINVDEDNNHWGIVILNEDGSHPLYKAVFEVNDVNQDRIPSDILNDIKELVNYG